jgi:hypothetical protein
MLCLKMIPQNLLNFQKLINLKKLIISFSLRSNLRISKVLRNLQNPIQIKLILLLIFKLNPFLKALLIPILIQILLLTLNLNKLHLNFIQISKLTLNLLNRTLRPNSPINHNNQISRQSLCLFQHMSSQNYSRGLLSSNFLDNTLHVSSSYWVHSGTGLVQVDNLRAS